MPLLFLLHHHHQVVVIVCRKDGLYFKINQANEAVEFGGQ